MSLWGYAEDYRLSYFGVYVGVFRIYGRYHSEASFRGPRALVAQPQGMQASAYFRSKNGSSQTLQRPSLDGFPSPRGFQKRPGGFPFEGYLS